MTQTQEEYDYKTAMKFEGEDLKEVVKDLKKQAKGYTGGQKAVFTRVVRSLERTMSKQ